MRWCDRCAALAPLTIGVILSAVTELNLVLVGFFAAIAAALANVLNSIYTKRAISHVACPDPIIFHMYTAATATIILLPYAVLKDARDWFNGLTHPRHNQSSSPTAASKQCHIHWLTLSALCHVRCSGVHYVFDKSAMAGDSAVAAQLLLFSVSLHYMQNISSIYFLAHVSVLSHQVAQSLKRLLVIACSVLYFHTPVTALNVIGMSLALVGFFAYSLTKQSAAAAAAVNVNGESWSSSTGKSLHSPHGNGGYSSHTVSDREGREHERGYFSGGANSRLRLANQPNTPRQSGEQYTANSPTNSANSSLSSSQSTSPSTHPSQSAVMDSYALVRASELGSSHLLQSPTTGPVQPQLRYPHSAHNPYIMQPLTLAPHQQQQQYQHLQQQRRASRDQSAGSILQHADNVGQHSHVLEMEEHAALLSSHDDHGPGGNHNGMR